MKKPTKFAAFAAAALAASSPLAAVTISNSGLPGSGATWPEGYAVATVSGSGLLDQFSDGTIVSETLTAGGILAESFRVPYDMELTGISYVCSGATSGATLTCYILDQGESDLAITLEDQPTLSEDNYMYDYNDAIYAWSDSVSTSGIPVMIRTYTLDSDDVIADDTTLYASHNYVIEIGSDDSSKEFYWTRFYSSTYDEGTAFKSGIILNGSSRDYAVAFYGYRPTSDDAIWPDTGFVDGTWYGDVWTEGTGSGWIYSDESMAWQYVYGTNSDSVWVYDLELGWLWTSSTDYSYFYVYATGTWAYMYRSQTKADTGRLFFTWKSDDTSGWTDAAGLLAGTYTEEVVSDSE